MGAKSSEEHIGNDGERLSRDAALISAVHHLHRYAIASSLCVGKQVADIASGEGYGSNLLSMHASKVIGIDISEAAVKHASNAYRRSNLHFCAGSAADVPLADHSVDVITSFETIEHHDKHEEMIREFKRILRPQGLLILSSPDKRYYRDVPKFNNPFHVKELYEDELKELVRKYFNRMHIYGQKLVGGSLLFSKEVAYSEFKVIAGDFDRVGPTNNVAGAQYLICLAGDVELPSMPVSFFDGELISEAQQRGDRLIADLRNSLSFKIGRLATAPLRWLHERF
jgi:ubiquinone/menaquinone biosynthesis C-methylase UbiE